MTTRPRRSSEKAEANKLDDSTRSNGTSAFLTEREYFWSIKLDADNETFTWMKNDDMEDDDDDFIEHTVFLKTAVLGENAVPSEHNIVTLEAVGGDGGLKKGAIIGLCRGQTNMATLDLTVSGRLGPATFTLVEGSGPVFISGNELMEFPKEENNLDNSQTESEEEETEEEQEAEEEEQEAEEDEDGEEVVELEAVIKKNEPNAKKSSKRKAVAITGKAKQKSKMEVDDEEEEEEDDNDEAEEEEEEEEEESESDEESEEEVRSKKVKKSKEGGKKDKDTPKAKGKKSAKKSKK